MRNDDIIDYNQITPLQVQNGFQKLLVDYDAEISSLFSSFQTGLVIFFHRLKLIYGSYFKCYQNLEILSFKYRSGSNGFSGILTKFFGEPYQISIEWGNGYF